jgi:hypothetical protein
MLNMFVCFYFKIIILYKLYNIMVKLEDFKVGEIKKMVSKYNKQVKIGPISKLNKADLIKHIREHPKLTVQESEKGVKISVKDEVNIGDKKIKVKKDIPEKPEKPDTAKQPEKPEIPSITVTEEEKPKRKVIKKGGRFITVKEKKDIAKQPEEPEVTEAPKTKPKKIRLPKEEEKKDEEIIKNMKEIVEKYNKEEIKKQTKITRKNNDVFTKPFLNLAQKIENQLKTINNPFEFLKKHVELNEKYADTTKNFVRRIRIQLKKNEEEEKKKAEPKKEEPKKEEPKMSKKEMVANLRKYNKENK